MHYKLLIWEINRILFFICLTRNLCCLKESICCSWGQCSNWLEKIIALGADGAAVNLGSKGGVIALLQQEAGDHIVPFHCMPHR